MSKMGRCKICGKSVDYPGSTQHAKKHRREFEEETGYSRHVPYPIIKAYYGVETRAWAYDIVENLKESGRIPKDTNLEDFTEKEVDNQ